LERTINTLDVADRLLDYMEHQVKLLRKKSEMDELDTTPERLEKMLKEIDPEQIRKLSKRFLDMN